MVTRASPGADAVVLGATRGSDGGGGAIVPARWASALSTSSVCLSAWGGRDLPAEESLQKAHDKPHTTTRNPN